MEKKLVNDLQKELHLKTTELFHINIFSECFLDLFLINIGEEKNLIPKYIIKNNNDDNDNGNN